LTVYKAIWEYIALPEYSKPVAPTGEVVRGRLASARKLLRPNRRPGNAVCDSLSNAPPYLLNRAAPAPDLEQMVTALEVTLHNWFFTRDPKRSVKIVVGPPGSNVEQTVAAYGRRKKWPVFGPPTPAEILAGGRAWLENLQGDEITPVVIPRLGSCYLRHHNGLALLGRLLDWLESSRRRCLLACDSWAWAYLTRALHIDAMLPTPLTLAAIDGKRLQFWLATLARADDGRFVFRDASNGQSIITRAASDDDLLLRNAQPGQMESFGEWAGAGHHIKQLAAYSRGLPEVAWRWWRECLQVSPETDNEIMQGMKRGDEWYTVWVKPWSSLSLPSVPHSSAVIQSTLLHALLLHGGATSGLLEVLLPFSHNEIRHVLHRLVEARLVRITAGGRWQVTLLGYPAVRQYMENEGYLVDAF
jgi:hypothetical protein